MDYGTIKHKNNNAQLLSQSILHEYEGGGQRSLNEILDNIYPIGSIYLSTNSTNPSNYFGGVWEQIKDRFLLACGDTYKIGSTGGSTTHTILTENLPWQVTVRMNVSNGWGNNNWGDLSGWGNYQNNSGGHETSRPINHIPPYLAIYVWTRIS